MCSPSVAIRRFLAPKNQMLHDFPPARQLESRDLASAAANAARELSMVNDALILEETILASRANPGSRPTFNLTLTTPNARLHRRNFSAKLMINSFVVTESALRNHSFNFITIVVFLIVALSLPAAAAKKIIIDTDPGTDDALALMLALNSPELDVRALTIVPGNVDAEMGLANALRMVSLAGRCDIPVAAGARHPLFQKLITAQFWHGKNGLGDVELPPSKCMVAPEFGPDLIIKLIHASPHEITLVPIGPLTNIALAVEKDPSIVPLVKEVILMGGSISGGNVNAAAEANIYNDPEAAQVVFQAGFNSLIMSGLEVGNKALFTPRHLDQLGKTHGPINDFVHSVLNYLENLAQQFGGAGVEMYDPSAVAIAIDASLVKVQPMHVDVETRGDFTRGETVGNRRGYDERNVLHGDHYEIDGVEKLAPNAKVCVDVNADRFLQLFISRIQGK
jgi:purine nucleosidase